MGTTEQRILGIAGAGLILGILGDLLLRTAPWGINVMLWTGAFLGAAAVLIRWQGIRVAPETFWLSLPVVLFSAAIAWRDSNTLKLLNVTAICVAFALAALRSQSGRLVFGGVLEYSIGLLGALLRAIPGFAAGMNGVCSRLSLTKGFPKGKTMAVGRGILIAIPLLLLFGKLLTDADASFEQLVRELLTWDFPSLFLHLGWITLCGAIGCGILYRILLANDIPDPLPERPSFLSLGVIEAGVVLITLNLLFSGFIAAQFGYFFGGADVAASSHALSIADYARRGFFELVAVTLLVLPLLLSMHWLFRIESARDNRTFGILSGLLVAMLFVVMTSALHRMFLYQDMYGLTELRLYTTVFMGWLALLFVWFLLTVLRGKRERFAFGAVAAGLALLAMLNIINPDGLIVLINTGRASSGKDVDICYLATLSDDALPGLIGALPRAKQPTRSYLSQKLLASLPERQSADWRGWNWGAGRAMKEIRRRQIELMRMVSTP
ncbi:DUF4153 domain-containing protein [Geobacter sp. AOG1]|uniref:DUF4153 domain-containing protein n=1 Tax=Geobacter sp. AOG1 TaxID=1566346 RepID=UPI001CC529C0|nr:DUF4173 domain-containing protein [Geobacter sp. AOG1]GFE59266.1 hypothetical protein AOG1_31460 [Geobacter sp. AOG1]